MKMFSSKLFHLIDKRYFSKVLPIIFGSYILLNHHQCAKFISTLRFCALPSAVSLDAIGLLEP